MPTPRKNETVRCTHFVWRLLNRGGTWYADGRSNTPSAGRHSLGTQRKEEALQLLIELDRVRAEDLGLIPRSRQLANHKMQPLLLKDGRKFYEAHIARPRITGGVRKSSQKRYRTVFDKFLSFCASRSVTAWNAATAQLLTDYAAFLEAHGYAHKTIAHELTTLKQAVRWLISEGHLRGMAPIDLKLRKVEGESAYCYRAIEVKAMVAHCREDDDLLWLANIIAALACTGLRIGELASLRWSDIDLEEGRLSLTDETGYSGRTAHGGRELKSGRNRSFPIHPDLLTVFRGMSCQDRYVFHGPRGGRLKPDTVRRILVREVIEPLASKFPTADREKGFIHGRLHSFRHFFCSTCANNNVPERMVMDWLGHADSAMIRFYYHLHDEDAKRRMNSLDFLGVDGGRSAKEAETQCEKEDAEPPTTEKSDDVDGLD